MAIPADASNETLDRTYVVLLATRPIAINLRWALDDMRGRLRNLPRNGRVAAAYQRAAEICEEDITINSAIGEHGLKIFCDVTEKRGRTSLNVQTHCNAGWLATVKYQKYQLGR